MKRISPLITLKNCGNSSNFVFLKNLPQLVTFSYFHLEMNDFRTFIPHCAEFIYNEWLEIFSYPFLSEDNRPSLNNQITNRNTQ